MSLGWLGQVLGACLPSSAFSWFSSAPFANVDLGSYKGINLLRMPTNMSASKNRHGDNNMRRKQWTLFSVRQAVRPSVRPSDRAFDRPTVQPSVGPSVRPSYCAKPSVRPSVRPSIRPSVRPSDRPSVRSSDRPTVRPSDRPSDCPSVLPYVISSRKKYFVGSKRCFILLLP